MTFANGWFGRYMAHLRREVRQREMLGHPKIVLGQWRFRVALGSFMQSWEVWVKAIHVISVIAWMAGLLYLPRLFVYHTQCASDSQQSETFKIMERRLLRAIMNPAMIIVWVTGPLVAYGFGELQSTWLHAKLGLVLVLSAFHGYVARQVRIFAAGANGHSTAFYRVLNEVPTVLMILIVILVVVKPY